jgi:soluble lytic murein transglycosylase-like protein
LPLSYRPPRQAKTSPRHQINELIKRTADRYQVDHALVKAVVAAESNFEPRAVSSAGAMGLMQIMPDTARELGVRAPFKPSDNLSGGVRYLRSMLDRYQDVAHALAAYNAGPHVVDRYGSIPPYPETEAYVKRVLAYYRDFQAQPSN